MRPHRPARAVLATLTACLLLTSLGGCRSNLPDDYDYKINMKAYEKAITTTDQAYLKLVNKQNAVEKDYAPAILADIPADLTLYGKDIQLESTAALAAEALLRELHARGYADIMITSGYRSYQRQEELFRYHFKNEQAAHPAWNTSQCEAEVLTYSARPGQSEHQSGLCMDLISTGHLELDETFAQNPVYAYLVDNAHHFGFILRYPSDKTDVTGYSYEPWHYRFVGIEAATAIYEGGLTLEEYLA